MVSNIVWTVFLLSAVPIAMWLGTTISGEEQEYRTSQTNYGRYGNRYPSSTYYQVYPKPLATIVDEPESESEDVDVNSANIW